jgi:lactocepin
MVEFDKIYKNGYFIEGFVCAFESVEEGEYPDKASVPFLGFSGDWDALPMFDYTGNFMKTSLYSTIYLGEEVVYYELSESLFDEGFTDPRFMYISPNNDGINDDLMVNIQLLRNARHLVIELYNEDGEQLLSDPWEYTTKAGTDEDGSLIYDNSVLYYLVDSDNTDYIYPDGRYRVVIKASPESAPELFGSYELEFVIDTKKPVLDYSKIEIEDGYKYLTVKVSDDNLISLISLYEGESEDDEYTPYTEDVLLYSDEISGIFEYTFNITDIESDHIYLDIYDASYNVRTVRIDLN